MHAENAKKMLNKSISSDKPAAKYYSLLPQK